jgi:hypothetical protein
VKKGGVECTAALCTHVQETNVKQKEAEETRLKCLQQRRASVPVDVRKRPPDNVKE